MSPLLDDSGGLPPMIRVLLDPATASTLDLREELSHVIDILYGGEETRRWWSLLTESALADYPAKSRGDRLRAWEAYYELERRQQRSVLQSLRDRENLTVAQRQSVDVAADHLANDSAVLVRIREAAALGDGALESLPATQWAELVAGVPLDREPRLTARGAVHPSRRIDGDPLTISPHAYPGLVTLPNGVMQGSSWANVRQAFSDARAALPSAQRGPWSILDYGYILPHAFQREILDATGARVGVEIVGVVPGGFRFRRGHVDPAVSLADPTPAIFAHHKDWANAVPILRELYDLAYKKYSKYSQSQRFDLVDLIMESLSGSPMGWTYGTDAVRSLYRYRLVWTSTALPDLKGWPEKLLLHHNHPFQMMGLRNIDLRIVSGFAEPVPIALTPLDANLHTKGENLGDALGTHSVHSVLSSLMTRASESQTQLIIPFTTRAMFDNFGPEAAPMLARTVLLTDSSPKGVGETGRSLTGEIELFPFEPQSNAFNLALPIRNGSGLGSL